MTASGYANKTGKIPKKGLSKTAHINAYMDHYPFSGQQRKKEYRREQVENGSRKDIEKERIASKENIYTKNTSVEEAKMVKMVTCHAWRTAMPRFLCQTEEPLSCDSQLARVSLRGQRLHIGHRK